MTEELEARLGAALQGSSDDEIKMLAKWLHADPTREHWKLVMSGLARLRDNYTPPPGKEVRIAVSVDDKQVVRAQALPDREGYRYPAGMALKAMTRKYEHYTHGPCIITAIIPEAQPAPTVKGRVE